MWQLPSSLQPGHATPAAALSLYAHPPGEAASVRRPASEVPCRQAKGLRPFARSSCPDTSLRQQPRGVLRPNRGRSARVLAELAPVHGDDQKESGDGEQDACHDRPEESPRQKPACTTDSARAQRVALGWTKDAIKAPTMPTHPDPNLSGP